VEYAEQMQAAVDAKPAAPAPFPSKAMTVKQAAEYIGCTTETLCRWHGRGVGPPRVGVGRFVRYHIDTLDEWLKGD
jgi:excisionase family DNA binding protein